MTTVLRIDNQIATPLTPTSMAAEQLAETAHLEPWLVQNIQAIDPDLKVVATQYDRWSSDAATAAQRLDLLALARSGELVVIELKRGSDKNIHVQAISYGALVSGFTIETLGHVHSDWLNKTSGSSQTVSFEQAMESLRAYVDDEEWSDDVLQQTRLILVAESFPPVVLTTLQWLARRAPELRIECHRYSVFRDAVGLMVAFDRLYPVDDLSDQVLVPSGPSFSPAARVATTQRQARSVTRIHQVGAIPVGARIVLNLATHARPQVVAEVERWLLGDSTRPDVTWVDDPRAPLRWGADPTIDSWTPSALRNRIFVDAGQAVPSFSAADAWSYKGRSLYQVANEAEGH